MSGVPRKSPNSAYRIYDGEATIVLPDRSEVKILNPIGSLVWDRMDGTRTVEDLVEAVVQEYEIEPDQARRDVVEFINTLREHGMVA
jgi:Coenzyme PQQ synthesis protein D (PqqD)